MLTKTLASWLQRATTTQFGMSQFCLLSKLSNAPRNSFWEALSGICSRTIQHSDSQVNRLCISPDKRFLAAAGHHTVKLYDIKSTNPNPLLAFEGHTGNVTGVAFHCEGKWMVTSSEDGTVKIWETRSGSVQRSYSHGCPVNDVVIHPNQGEIISCDRGGSVRIWDLAENNCSHQLIPEEDVPVASVTVASDGSTLCAGTNTVCPEHTLAALLSTYMEYRAMSMSGIFSNTAKRLPSSQSPISKRMRPTSPESSSHPTSST
jgi:WD40 repeat protein